ncbi:hypothetical protein KKE92_01640 [Candidatus Micrarchaeota archaeon]|nr:hypothetical protein [Candidatus Micrarchaeota archaeon]MBU1682116.1 hypothetical protein [Candidatus Micrarchaeota archaeon]
MNDLLEKLKSPDIAQRRKAANNLSESGMDIAQALPAIKEAFGKEKDTWIKGILAGALAAHYVQKGMTDEAVKFLDDKNERVRYYTAKELRNASMAGADITAALVPLMKVLIGMDVDVRRVAGQAIVAYYAKRKQWNDINAILVAKGARGKYEIIVALQDFVSGVIELPSLLSMLKDGDFDSRKEAASVLRKASETGIDISFAVPALKSVLSDNSAGEEALNALKIYDLRASGKCSRCLEGLFEGDVLEKLATIIKGMSCCGGDVSHNIFRCPDCGKYYLTTFFDHSDFDHGQFYVYGISEKDAKMVVVEIGKCPANGNRHCDCQVHMVFLKDEKVPVDGKLKHSVEKIST